jgi:hypothetical protein
MQCQRMFRQLGFRLRKLGRVIGPRKNATVRKHVHVCVREFVPESGDNRK